MLRQRIFIVGIGWDVSVVGRATSDSDFTTSAAARTIGFDDGHHGNIVSRHREAVVAHCDNSVHIASLVDHPGVERASAVGRDCKVNSFTRGCRALIGRDGAIGHFSHSDVVIGVTCCWVKLAT